MPNSLSSRSDTESPFFSLLSEADQVQIREVPLESRERMVSSLEKTLRDFESDKGSSNLRTFFVHIRVPAPKAETAESYQREYLIGSAQVLLDNNEFVLARNLYSYVLKDGVRDPVALRGLGICFFRLGEIVSAKKCFKALCELQATGDAHFWMGQCHLAQGDDTTAAVCFQKCGPLEKDLQFDLLKNWGNCLTRMGKNEEAAEKYEQALRLNPDSDVLLVNLGTLSLQRQDTQNAETWFRRALALNAKNSKALCGLGLVALTYERAADAIELLQAALDLDSQNIVALHQLILLAEGPCPQVAIKPRLHQFLAREPRNVDIQVALAVVLFKEGAWKDSEAHADRALEIEPSHARAQELKSELAKLKR